MIRPFGNHANQTDLNSRPTLRTAAEGNNNRYFMKFNSNQTIISDINLNADSGHDDIVNIFIVYRLEANTTSYPANLTNSLFGHDKGGIDRFICFTKFGHMS